VRARPGVRVPGALDPFEAALRALVAEGASAAAGGLLERVVGELGDPVDTGDPALSRLAPTAERVAECGAAGLAALGVRARSAGALAAIARRMADGALRLETGGDVTAAHAALVDLGAGDAAATTIVQRTLYWPDALPADDPALASLAASSARAESWRPWRAYAAAHLRLHDLSSAR
jgi:AraC family transcriptional regulator of adaptative response / DNA-3-methyladenine glycosylase II